jgi:hypothetical protein
MEIRNAACGEAINIRRHQPFPGTPLALKANARQEGS